MTTKEAFRLGFLARLAERGISPSQFEKSAGVVADVTSTVSNLAGALTPMALAALVGVPAAAGVLTGIGKAELMNVSEEDLDQMKQEDFANTYRSEARRIRNRLNRSKWKQLKRSKGRPDGF